MRPFLACLLAFFLVGCSALQNKVVVSTGTSIGIDISENPATGLYQAKLGYNRGELALIPTTNNYVPDVITEINFKGMFSKDGGIYQRLAVGPNAVKQPGAMGMFLKDVHGNVDTNALILLERALTTVEETPSAVQDRKLKLSLSYDAEPNQSNWDTVAKQLGYESFGAFLIAADSTVSDCDRMEKVLREKGLIP